MGESISKTWKKINVELKGKPFLSIILTLILCVSYLSYKILTYPNLFSAKAFDYQASNISAETLKKANSIRYIYASRRGSKYYFYNCKSSIKESNKIFFDSEGQAQKAGYTLAKTCQ